jgi:hypothetical protein
MSDTGLDRIDCGNDIFLYAPAGSRVDMSGGRAVITTPDAAWRAVITRHPVKGVPDLAAESERVFRTFVSRQSDAVALSEPMAANLADVSAMVCGFRITAGSTHRVEIAVFIHADAAYSIVLSAREGSPGEAAFADVLSTKLRIEQKTASLVGSLDFDLLLPGSAASTVPPEAYAQSARDSSSGGNSIEFTPSPIAAAPLPTLTFIDPAAADTPPASAPPVDESLGALPLPTLTPKRELKLAEPPIPKFVPHEISLHGVQIMAPGYWELRGDANGIEDPGTGSTFMIIGAQAATAQTPKADLVSAVETTQSLYDRIEPTEGHFKVRSPVDMIEVAGFHVWEPGDTSPSHVFVLSWFTIPTQSTYITEAGDIIHLCVQALLITPPGEIDQRPKLYRSLLAGISTTPEKNRSFAQSQGLTNPEANAAEETPKLPVGRRDDIVTADEVYAPHPRPRQRPFELDDIGVDISVPANWKRSPADAKVVGDEKTGVHLYVAAVSSPVSISSLERWARAQEAELVASSRRPTRVGPIQRVRRAAHEAMLMEFDYVQPDTGLPFKLFAYCTVNSGVPDAPDGNRQQLNILIGWRIPLSEFEPNEGLYRWLVQTQATIRRANPDGATAASDSLDFDLPGGQTDGPDNPGRSAKDAPAYAQVTTESIERPLRVARWWMVGAISTYFLALMFYAGLGMTYPELVVLLAAVGVSIWGTRLYSQARGWPQWKFALTVIGLVIPVVGFILCLVLYSRVGKHLEGNLEE